MARSEGLEPSLKVLETLVLPDKLRTHMERMVGVEPTTNSLENCYSTVELHSHNVRDEKSCMYIIILTSLTSNIIAHLIKI